MHSLNSLITRLWWSCVWGDTGHTLVAPHESFSSPKHPASDCLNIPFLKPSISQRPGPSSIPHDSETVQQTFFLSLTIHTSCCVTAVCSVPASAAPLHPSVLWDQECACLGGRSVPLPVSYYQAQTDLLFWPRLLTLVITYEKFKLQSWRNAEIICN